jgi:hypothetical protein
LSKAPTSPNASPYDAIVLAIIQMGHSLNLQVIAEGVETAPQLAYLRRHLCDQIQGFYFSPPLPVPALELLLLAHTSLTAPDGDTTVSRHGSWASSGNVSGATDVPARRSCSPLGVVEGQQALTVDPD